jgi:hypothetical protein
VQRPTAAQGEPDRGQLPVCLDQTPAVVGGVPADGASASETEIAMKRQTPGVNLISVPVNLWSR